MDNISKKKIKIAFTGFWKSFDPNSNMITNILKKHFDIEISDTAPDFVICSP